MLGEVVSHLIKISEKRMMWIFKKMYSIVVSNFSSKIFHKLPKGMSKTFRKIKKLFLDTFVL